MLGLIADELWYHSHTRFVNVAHFAATTLTKLVMMTDDDVDDDSGDNDGAKTAPDCGPHLIDLPLFSAVPGLINRRVGVCLL